MLVIFGPDEGQGALPGLMIGSTTAEPSVISEKAGGVESPRANAGPDYEKIELELAGNAHTRERAEDEEGDDDDDEGSCTAVVAFCAS